MTILKYTGTTDPYFETTVTGQPRVWHAGTRKDVPSGDVAALLATGLFVNADSPDVLTPAQVAQTQALVSDAGNVPALLALLAGGGAGPAQTFANALATVAADAGKTTRITDIGRPGAGTLMISDGVSLAPIGSSAPLMRSTMPMVMPPNLTVAANGALTLSVALPAVYNSPSSGNGGCYMYFLAGQVYSGSPAGWYYVSMSSTTIGTVYNNLHTGGWPRPPAVPAGLVTASVGATSSDFGNYRTALSVTLPGGAMGKHGRLRDRLTLLANASGGASRFAQASLAGFAFHTATISTTGVYSSPIGEVVNMGQANRQQTTTNNSGSGLSGELSSYTPVTNTIDTSADQAVSIALRNSSGSDYLIMLAGEMELVGG